MADLIPPGTSLNAGRAAINQKIVDMDKRVNNILSSSGNSNAETKDARYDKTQNVTYPLLGDRLDALSRDKETKTTSDQKLSLKADKTFVDIINSKVDAVSSGSPKGVYSTLAALQSAIPSGNSNIYVVSADGNWYFWSGAAWTAGGVYQSTGLVNGTVTPEKTSFITNFVGKNLYDKSKAVDGYVIEPTNGNLTANSAHSSSDWITINPSANYVKTNQGHIAFYNSSKVYISGINESVATDNASFTTPATASYLRFSIKNYTQAKKDSCQLETGVTPTDYEPYALFMVKPENLPPIPGSKLAEGAITFDKTTFFQKSKNLFDKNKATDGYLIDPNNGVATVNAAHCASDWITVNPNSNYVKNCQGHIAFYTAAKAFISGVNESTAIAGYVITTPANCAYIRFSIRNFTQAIKDTCQLELGTVPTLYQAFGGVIKPELVSSDNIKINGSQITDLSVSPQKCDFFTLGKNLYDKSKATDGILINGNSAGQATSWPTHSASDWISVTPSLKYVWNVGVNYAIYDVSKVFVSGKNSNLAGSSITIPTNGAFVRFSVDLNVSGIKDTCQFEQGLFSTAYAAFGLVVDPKRIYIPPTGTIFQNLKWNVLGDSITQAERYQTLTAIKLGIGTVRSYGIGGTKIADTTGSDSNAFVNRFSVMDNDADIVSVMGGTNDWGQNVIISNPSNNYDKSTLTGAIRTIIEGLIIKYPGKYILWATLPQRNNVTYPDGINANGNSTQDYVTAIKNVCKEYAIPCIDVHNESGINKYNMDTNGSLMPDRVHPSEAGYKRVASLFADMLSKIVY